ncbi:hypothetical protein EDC04DRAFT_1162252 [Pisolithus marmoratus]|nr:hypothetical protein EDC04DRAFT_1162252 [Pisolithus marmoratus]
MPALQVIGKDNVYYSTNAQRNHGRIAMNLQSIVYAGPSADYPAPTSNVVPLGTYRHHALPSPLTLEIIDKDQLVLRPFLPSSSDNSLLVRVHGPFTRIGTLRSRDLQNGLVGSMLYFTLRFGVVLYGDQCGRGKFLRYGTHHMGRPDAELTVFRMASAVTLARRTMTGRGPA